MSATAGQATRGAGQWLSRLLQFLLALAVLALLAIGALTWRLAEGPLALPWLARRIEAAAAAQGQNLHVARATLSWAGFRSAEGSPLLLRLSGLQLSDGAQAATLAELEASFSVPALVFGRVVPNTVIATGARLHLTRDAGGGLTVAGVPADTLPSASGDQLPPSEQLRALTQPGGALAALLHLHLHDAYATLDDQGSKLRAELGPVAIDLDRADGDGGLTGHASAAIAVGAQHATLTLDTAAGDSGTELRASLTPLSPAALAPLSPAWAAAAALDAPVTLAASATLGPDLGLRHLHADVALGSGIVRAGTGTAPILGAALSVDGTLDRMAVTLGHVEMTPGTDRPHTTFTGRGILARATDGYNADLALEVDHLTFEDLPALWPAGTGGPGTKPWISGNITSGVLRDGHLSLSLHTPSDLSDVRLLSIYGRIDGQDLTVWWLRPVPPIEHIDGQLTITDPDVIELALSGGVQSGGAEGGIRLGQGHIRLSGIAGNDQFADIADDLGGPVADLLHTLAHPRLKLLSRQPVPLRDPAGQLVGGHLSVGHLELKESVSMDDIAIRATGHLASIHLTALAAGRDLDQGQLDMVATNEGLSLDGTADLAHIPAKLAATMDFRAGPPTQVQQLVHVQASVSDRQLAGLGLATHGFMTGSGDLDATVTSHRNARVDIAATADLTHAALVATQAAYAKPLGQPATAQVRLALAGERLAAISSLRLSGSGVDVRGSADVANGRPEVLRLDRIVLGEGTDASGTVVLPQRPADAYGVTLSGSSLDLSGVLGGGDKSTAKLSPAPGGQATPPLLVRAHFDTVLLGQGRRLTGVAADVAYDGSRWQRASVSGNAAGSPPGAAAQAFSLSVAPVAGGRQLRAQAADLGALLQAAGVTAELRGGSLTLSGRYDDTRRDQVLTGAVELRDFRVLDAPAVGRILQAATLYGVIDLLRGPGLFFSRAVTDFTVADGSRIDLHNARAYSASLGATAQGGIDLDRRTMDLRGTVVPAYFFNTLPGRIPLIGRLFSPEKGGGLFAATVSVRGPFTDLAIGVNPVAALAPGVLRKMFDLFGSGK